MNYASENIKIYLSIYKSVNEITRALIINRLTHFWQLFPPRNADEEDPQLLSISPAALPPALLSY